MQGSDTRSVLHLQKMFGDYTYKWWPETPSCTPIHDLIKFDGPVFMAHGTEDTSVPIKYTDLVADKFSEKGKDIHYLRINNCDHNLMACRSVNLLEEIESWILQNSSYLW